MTSTPEDLRDASEIPVHSRRHPSSAIGPAGTKAGSRGSAKKTTAVKNTGKSAGKSAGTERMAFRLPDDVAQQMRYWADQHKVSINEYVVEALRASIRWENQDYPLPTLEQHRLNQMIDELRSVSSRLSSLERVVVVNSESIIGLARGDSYLLDEEDGEL